MDTLPPLFHGTYEFFPIGVRLKGRGDAYDEDWSVLGHYEAVHHHKPEEFTAHRDAVFLCELDDIDACGGATENVSLMRPIGPVTRHDLNWSGKIDLLLNAGHQVESEVVRDLCLNYWHGVPTEDPLWEYIAQEAEVLASATFEDADVLYDFLDEEMELSCEM